MRALPKFIFPKPFATDFTIQNLPYGVFRKGNEHRIGVAIGDKVLDCATLADRGLLPEFFREPTLNTFMSQSRETWKEVRATLTALLSDDHPKSLQNLSDYQSLLLNQSDVKMVEPAHIGDYTDFYASREHATNVGVMFRGKENALMPNWLHLPVGYHGRASSVRANEDVRRPHGQAVPPSGPEIPTFGPSKRVDFELEMGCFLRGGNPIGRSFTLDEAEDNLFGIVLLNDWSARDMQKWEYQPLGPFLAKSFGTTISPWIVTTEALAPFRMNTPVQSDPEPLPYLRQKAHQNGGFDINLEVSIKPKDDNEAHVVCRSNLKYMYWSLAQQLTHHASNGCPMRPGDLIGTGTISGPTEDSYGSMLELSWGGKNDVQVGTQTRKFIHDEDTVIIKGHCEKDGLRIGFGECRSKLLPAL